MAARSLTVNAKYRSYLRGLVNLRHMTRLTALLAGIGAMKPLRVRHLLIESRNLFSASAQGFRDQSVARAAQRRFGNVRARRGTESTGGGVHDVLLAQLDHIGAVFVVIVFQGRRINDEVADVAFRCAQALRADLMADGAGDAIFGGSIVLLVGTERKMGEDLTQLAMQLGFVSRNRHVADRTFILDTG